MSGVLIGEHGGSLQIPVSALDAAATGDTPVSIPFARYMVRRVTVYDPSANLAATTAALSLRDAAAGAGTAIVSAQALTALTGGSVLLDATLALASLVLTAATLYLRIVQGVAPVAGTVKVILEVQPLP